MTATAPEEKQPLEGEQPVGTCPACRELVYNSLETSGPVWTCPKDINPNNPYWEPSVVTPAQQARDGDYSLCPSAHDLDRTHCETYLHLPLHSACYDKGNY